MAAVRVFRSKAAAGAEMRRLVEAGEVGETRVRVKAEWPARAGGWVLERTDRDRAFDELYTDGKWRGVKFEGADADSPSRQGPGWASPDTGELRDPLTLKENAWLGARLPR